jgi:hypothetical protein
LKLKLLQTCSSSPEQYDAYLGDELVGYLRLRHGYFRAECHGKVVYDSYPKGDGIFEDDEREQELNNACKAILATLYAKEDGLLFEITYKE